MGYTIASLGYSQSRINLRHMYDWARESIGICSHPVDIKVTKRMFLYLLQENIIFLAT